MKQSFFIVVTILGFAFCSCIEPVYIPNKSSIPMFRREKQFYASAAYVDDSGPTLNTAYSVYGPLYIGAGFNIQDKLVPFKESFSTSFVYGEVGYTYWFYPALGAELSAGYGIGASQTYDELGELNSHYYDHNTVKYGRFHIQPALCFHAPLSQQVEGPEDPWRDIVFEGALSLRFSALRTSQYDVTYYNTSNMIDSTGTKSYSQAFFEPAITVRIGVEHLMLEGQFGSSNYASKTVPDNAIPHKDKFISIGLVSKF